jgi:hypothetical protein
MEVANGWVLVGVRLGRNTGQQFSTFRHICYIFLFDGGLGTRSLARLSPAGGLCSSESPGFPNLYDVGSGTSVASPHLARCRIAS